jgi:hypothetical protein
MVEAGVVVPFRIVLPLVPFAPAGPFWFQLIARSLPRHLGEPVELTLYSVPPAVRRHA